MTGVDKLIADGVVDGDKMGALGWSAGGHCSNWIITHTDRFKAISTGRRHHQLASPCTPKAICSMST
jgi:dipeptidyl aminopeptidase/acylaminoacyl peptidase